MLALLLALTAFVGWGLNDALIIRLFRYNDPAKITVASGIVRLFGWLLLLPLFFSHVTDITLKPLLFNLIAGFSSGFGYYLFGKASQKTNPMIVTAISGGWGVSAVFLGILLFNERFTPFQLLSTVLVFVGLFLTIFKLGSIKTLAFYKDNGILYALGVFLIWGVCGALLKIPAVAYGWYWTSIIMLVPYLPIMLLTERKTIELGKLTRINKFPLFLLTVLTTILGDLGYNSSFSYGGSVFLVGTIGGSYAVLSTILAYMFYKEIPDKQQLVGIITSLLGIVLVAVSTSY